MNEIDKIISRSSRQELVEFLQDPECELDSAVLCYRKPDGEYGFRKLEGSSITSIIGMLRVICQYYERIEVDVLLETEDEED